MRSVSNDFKTNIKKHGRQQDAQITVDSTLINGDDINSVVPFFKSSLFKTIMQGLEIDSNVEIEKGKFLNARLGVKFGSSVYEYIEYNNYKVHSVEKQEDTESYKIIAYDKILDSMIDYDLTLTEKITVREYLIIIYAKLGWNQDGIPDTFINSEKLVDPFLHTEVKYTFRDVLDEICTITGSFIVVKNNIPTLTYINATSEVIDEEYISEDDVTIGEKYFINSLVFSRFEEADNIVRQDSESISQNGIHEYKIKDNQLLSTNDRDIYIDDLFNYLKTLKFYIYDVKSTGVMWLEPADLFKFSIRGNNYPVLLINNEIIFDQDIEEKMYMDEPDETETDYKYADSTDKRDSRVYALVDKQNKKIELVAEEQTEHTTRITKAEQDVESITQKVENITNLTREVEIKNIIKIEDAGNINLLYFELQAENTIKNYVGINYAGTSYANNSKTNITLVIDKQARNITEEAIIKTYTVDLLRKLDNVADKFVIDIDKETNLNIVKILRYIKFVDGEYITLETAEEEILEQNVNITLFEGTNYIYIKEIYNWNMKIEYLVKNDFNGVYATKVEMNSKITQNSNSIMQEVNLKVDENELGTKIEQNPEWIKYAWNQISQFLKIEGLNGKATLNIYNESDKMLMSISDVGQTFYNETGQKIGTIGLENFEDNKTLAFALDGNSNNLMSWGIKVPNGNYLPLLYMTGGYVEGSEYAGYLVVAGTLNMGDMPIKLANITTQGWFNEYRITDTENNKILMNLSWDDSIIAGKMRLYKNNYNNNVIDFLDGYLFNMSNVAESYDVKSFTGTGGSGGYMNVYFRDGSNITLTPNSSDMKLKKEISDSNTKALDIINKIQHREFKWKDSDIKIETGYIAQELEKLDSNFVYKIETDEKCDYSVNILNVLATATKAMQELNEVLIKQQEEIKILKEEVICLKEKSGKIEY